MTARPEESVITRCLDRLLQSVFHGPRAEVEEAIAAESEIKRRVSAVPQLERLLVEARKHLDSDLDADIVERLALRGQIDSALGGRGVVK